MNASHAGQSPERQKLAREQQRLLQRWRLRGDRESRTRVIEVSLPLVRRVAQRFRSSGDEYEDLLQAGTEGLIKAVDRYEPERRESFASYAVPKIAGEIKHHLRDHTWDLHVPRTARERAMRVAAARSRFAARNGRAPCADELAREANIDPAEAAEALLAGEAYCASSLQAPTGEGIPVQDTIGARDQELALADDRVTLVQSMRALPARERTVVALRFWRDLSQREIASAIGVSQIQVSRLLRAALAHLRVELHEGRAARRRRTQGRVRRRGRTPRRGAPAVQTPGAGG